MATRWKRERTVSLVLLHSHNRMSRWHGYLFAAARKLNLVMGFRMYANHHDGSTDREWYCIASQVETAGGMSAVQGLADDMRQADENATNDCEFTAYES